MFVIIDSKGFSYQIFQLVVKNGQFRRGHFKLLS